jgi:hypothetical protein
MNGKSKIKIIIIMFFVLTVTNYIIWFVQIVFGDEIEVRPNADGYSTQWDYSSSGHWQDTSDNSDSTYVYTQTEGEYEAVNLTNVPQGATIKSVQMTWSCGVWGGSGAGERIDSYLRINSQNYQDLDREVLSDDTFTNYTGTNQTTSPATGDPWTENEVNEMQAVVYSETLGTGEEIRCSEVYVRVWYTTEADPPTFTNNNSNTTSIYTGEPVLIYANWSDETNLDYAWLSTNETGVWFNYTDGTYGSPIDINLTADETWSNFTWDNDTFVTGVVAWKIYANDSIGNENVTGETTFNVNPGRLEVNLSSPLDPTNVIQNNTFTINATVYCRDGNCGNVNGTARYNFTSSIPDTLINTTQGDKPFYIQETSPLAMKSCPTNPLIVDEFCNITWTVNATGDINTDWKIGVLFNSSNMGIQNNHTKNSTISILGCTIDITAHWSTIDFGTLVPSTGENDATGNENNEYNITVNSGSCNLDLYINGTNLTNVTYNSIIPVNNVTWSNTTNDYAESNELSHSTKVLKIDVPENTNVTTWYWINVPAVYAGFYNGEVFIWGVKNGESPP